MNKKIVLVGGVVIGLAAYGLANANVYQEAESGSFDFSVTLEEAVNDAGRFFEDVVMGGLNLSKMREVTAVDMQNANVQAFLQVIRTGEGTLGDNGYRTLYGGKLFDGFAGHPNIKVTAGRWTSTAAGAYQFLKSTWDETAHYMGLKDFSPVSQDWGAVGRIAARYALDDVKAGRFDVAIKKVAYEWASMPGSPYGQPVIQLTKARQIYQASGGAFA